MKLITRVALGWWFVCALALQAHAADPVRLGLVDVGRRPGRGGAGVCQWENTRARLPNLSATTEFCMRSICW